MPQRIVFTSIKLAAPRLAEMIQLPEAEASAILKELKTEGALGFSNHRVDLTALLPSVRAKVAAKIPAGEDISKDKYALECRKLVLACERMEFELDVTRGKYLLASDVIAQDEARLYAVRGVLVQKLRGELPPRLEGRTAVQIIEAMDGVIADVLSAMASAAKSETKNEKPNEDEPEAIHGDGKSD